VLTMVGGRPRALSERVVGFLYNESLALFRQYYQNPVVEVILASSIVVHSVCGILEIKNRRSTTNNVPLKVRLHRFAGIYMNLAIPAHVTATRIIGLITNKPRDFSDLSYTLVTWPYFFYPYYILFVVCGIYHMSYGLLQFTKQIRITRNWWYYVLIGTISAFAISGVITLGIHPLRNLDNSFDEAALEYQRFLPSSILSLLNLFFKK